MPEKKPDQTSRTKRVVVFSLTLALVAAGIHMWLANVGDRKTAWEIGFGIAVGLLFTVRGGSLPDFAYRYFHINADDDPSNLSPKIYLPILGVAILLAALLLSRVLHIRH